MLVQAVLFVTVYTGVTLNTDVAKGVVDRFRSLPVWRPAPLVGGLLGDGVRYAVAAALVVVLGLVLGFDAAGGVPGVLAAIALVIVFAFGLAWICTTVGLLHAHAQRGHERRLHGPLPARLPQQHLRGAVHPAELARGVRRRQPDLAPDTAVRGLMKGTTEADEIGIVLATAGALTAVFAPLTVRLYRGKG